MTSVVQLNKTDAQLETIRQQVRAAQEQDNLSQNQVAKLSGVHNSTLSKFMNGQALADVTPVASALERWLESRKQKSELPAAPSFIPTPTANRVYDALMYAQIAGDMALIFGGAGVGKTETLHHYANTERNAWVVDCTPTTATVGGCLRAIAHALGLRAAQGRADVQEIQIRDQMRNTGGLLILDEAQFLNNRALETVRRLAEMSGVGLALVGNETVYAQLTGGSRAAEFAQLFSRIGKRVSLTKPSAADVESLGAAWGVGAKEMKVLKEIADKPGALRGVTKTLRLASMFAKGADDQLSAGYIQAAWKELGGM